MRCRSICFRDSMTPLVVLLLVVAITSIAVAGRNAGGALIVHTNDAVSYTTSGSYCLTSYLPPSCEEAGTRTDKDENTPAVIWFLAAFPDTSNPAVTTIQFGIEHNLPPEQGYFERYVKCGDLELPDAGWPETGFGNLLSFGSTVHTEKLFPFYWFAAYGFEGAYLGTAAYPSTEEARFVDGSAPPVEDPITRFGTLAWSSNGSNTCPSLHEDGDTPADETSDPTGDEDPDDDAAFQPFESVLPLGGNRLWALGREVTSTHITLTFDGDTLYCNSQPLLPTPRRTENLLTDDQLRALYGTIPFIASLVDDGLAIRAAVDSFFNESDEAHLIARTAYSNSLHIGTAAAAESAIVVFERSGLIYDRFSDHPPTTLAGDTKLRVHFLGQPTATRLSLVGDFLAQPSQGYYQRAAIRFHELIRAFLSAPGGSLIVIYHGGIDSFSGVQADAAEEQLRCASQNDDLTSCPERPIPYGILRSFFDRKDGHQ